MTVHKRRRFRFGLRTMFVAVTMFGCWLGWQMNMVHQREAFIEAWRQRRRDRSELRAQHIEGGVIIMGTSESIQQAPSPRPTVPWYRRWLGDVPRQGIEVESRDDAARAVRLFPESKIRLYTRTTSLRPWEKQAGKGAQ